MSEMLTAVAIIFIVAGPFLFVANQLDLPAAPLLILAGIVAGIFIDEELALQLAQFGIALLVFTFGVGIQFSEVASIIEDSEAAALVQIVVVGALGFGFGFLVGLPPAEAMYIGIAAALSSTMVATALLTTEIRNDLLHGRLGESIQFIQDLVAVGIILVIGAEVLELDPIAQQIGYGVLFIAAAYFINRYAFDVMTRLADESDELMIIGVVSLLVIFIGAAQAVEVPIVVGAFAAGLAVRHDRSAYLGLFNGLESIKDFFVAIFFVTVGALIVVPFVEVGILESVEKLLLAAGLVFLTVIVKPAVTTAILIYRGYEARTATLVGLSTDQVSEFALIIAIEALLIGMLTQSVFDAIIFAAALTMITSTFTQRYNERIYRWLSTQGFVTGRHGQINQRSHVPADISDHVIIVGYGRKGDRLVETMEKHEYPYVVIENDPARWEDVRVNCDAYVLGDAMEEYTWEKARGEDARTIVSGTSSPVVSRQILALDYDTTVILRASDEQIALDLLEEGATFVAVPDLLAGEQLVTYVAGLLDGDLSQAELNQQGLLALEAGWDEKV